MQPILMSFWALVVSNSGASSDRAIAVQIEMQSQFSVSSQCPMRSNSLSLSPWSLLPTQKKEKGCVRGSITLLAERILLCKPIGRFTLFNESLGQCRKVLGRKRRYLNPILSRLSQKSLSMHQACPSMFVQVCEPERELTIVLRFQLFLLLK